MYCLKINQDLCTCCGVCDTILPGLLDNALNGRLLVSPSRVVAGTKERQQIDSAIEACDVNALTLEEMS